jgi:hypothetical protein
MMAKVASEPMTDRQRVGGTGAKGGACSLLVGPDPAVACCSEPRHDVSPQPPTKPTTIRLRVPVLSAARRSLRLWTTPCQPQSGGTP